MERMGKFVDILILTMGVLMVVAGMASLLRPT